MSHRGRWEAQEGKPQAFDRDQGLSTLQTPAPDCYARGSLILRINAPGVNPRQSADVNEKVVPLTLTDEEQLTFDRLLDRYTRLFIQYAPIIDVHAPAPNQPGRVAL